MSKIAILLPTRNRPNLLERFVDSVYKNCKNTENVSVYLYIDDDDELTQYALTSLSKKYGKKIKALVGSRILMSETANKLFSITDKEEDIIFLAGDDLVIRTFGWDELVISKFSEIPDKIALIHGDDLTLDPNYKSFATHPILHRRWIETVGYATPPYFSSDYADTWLNFIADSLNRKFKVDFINEHMHWTFGKSKMDMTYLENRQRFSKDNPASVYNSMLKKRVEDCEKLKALLNTTYEK